MQELRRPELGRDQALTVKLLSLALLSSLHPHGIARAQSWAQTSAPVTNWSAIACSADGRKVVAAVYGGPIYSSTDSGATWASTTAPVTNWQALVSSAEGRRLVAAVDGGTIY